MRILGVDPGPEHYGWALYDTDEERVIASSKATPVYDFPPETEEGRTYSFDASVFEMPQARGLAVGQNVLETARVVGRMEMQARFHNCSVRTAGSRIFPTTVRAHICGKANAKDSNVRRAIIDRFGGKAKAIGNKANPGPLYGVAYHAWQALAVALCWWDKRCEEAAA